MPGSKPGERRGGRKAGTPNKATVEIRSLARDYAPAAIEELARLSTEAQSEQARISACNAVLDRAWGKSQMGQPIEIELPDTSTVEGINQALAAIVAATASAKLSPTEAQVLCSVIDAQRKTLEIADLEKRIKRLEEARS